MTTSVIDLDGRGIKAGPLDAGTDRDTAKLLCWDRAEGAAELADRRSRGTDDEDVAAGSLPVGILRRAPPISGK